MNAAVITEVKKPVVFQPVPDPAAAPGRAIVPPQGGRPQPPRPVDPARALCRYQAARIPGSDGAGVGRVRRRCGRQIVGRPRGHHQPVARLGPRHPGPGSAIPHPRPARQRHVRRKDFHSRRQPRPEARASLLATGCGAASDRLDGVAGAVHPRPAHGWRAGARHRRGAAGAACSPSN